MKLTHEELQFLSTWAREEWEPACYQFPSHQLQLAHGVAGAELLMFIKAWTCAEGTKDVDILDAARNPNPPWPWSSDAEFKARLSEAANWRTLSEASENPSSSRG